MQAKVNILLVDDRLSNLIALEAMLDSMGQNLVRANSGAEALLQLLEQDFALILLDVQMGGMDGFETADLIKQRERSKTTPIIFITAIHRDTQNLYKGYSSGAVDYLFKPLIPDILRAKVSVFVDLYQKNHEIREKSTALEAMNRELKQQLNKVHVLNRKLEALNFELESFGYSVSHDLRAPLRSIKGFSQVLARSYGAALDAEGQDFLNRIVSACDYMGGLIEDLLQLSQVIRGKMEMQSFNLTDVAQDIVSQLQQSTPDRCVEVVIDPNLTVYGDGRLLRLALTNLLDNAWKFTRHTPNARIEIGCEWQSGHRVFYVHDNGAGFDMLYRDQLFQPFQRLHPQDEFEGNGVGLATVQRIIQRHGGEIWAIGEVGGGATFYFTLVEAPAD
jgi:two-component system sensor histidine kinase/response regulator